MIPRVWWNRAGRLCMVCEPIVVANAVDFINSTQCSELLWLLPYGGTSNRQLQRVNHPRILYRKEQGPSWQERKEKRFSISSLDHHISHSRKVISSISIHTNQ